MTRAVTANHRLPQVAGLPTWHDKVGLSYADEGAQYAAAFYWAAGAVSIIGAVRTFC